MKIVSFRLKPSKKGRREKERPAKVKPSCKSWRFSIGGISFPQIKHSFSRLRGAGKNTKRIMMLTLASVMLLTLFPLSSPGRAIVASASKRDLPIYNVQKDSKVVSLSFDAAWGNEDTQQLIDILEKYDIKATFFVVGDWVDKYPESVLALHEAGHEIMNHSSDHAHFPKLSAQQMIDDLTLCNEKIAAITGVSPTLFRPPYGDYSDLVVSTARSVGMYTIQWDVDTHPSKSKVKEAPGWGFFFHFIFASELLDALGLSSNIKVTFSFRLSQLMPFSSFIFSS